MQKFLKLSFLLVAVSIFATSCYKEDLQNLQKQIDELTGSTIATIDSQIKNINASISDLQSVENSLSGYITSLQSDNSKIKGQIEDLTSVDKNLSVKIDELKSFVNGELKSSKDWANATFATLAQYDSLATVVAGIPAKIDAVSKALGDAKGEITANYEKAIKDAVSASEESMKSWVNEKLTDYYTIAQLNATLDSLGQAQSAVDSTINAKIDEQKVALDTAKSQITAAYQAAIKTAVDSLEGKINTKLAQDIATAQSTLNGQITAINTEITNIKSRLDAAEANIEALINQIQSIVVIPTYSDGSVKITLEVDTLSFDIRPERIADSIATAWKYASNETRNDLISFKIQNVLTKGTSSPSSIVDTVFYKNGELKVGVQFANVTDSSSIASVHISSGATDISSDYFGLYKRLNYLCFEAKEAGSKVGMDYLSENGAPKMEYSTNGFDFNEWNGADVTLAKVGDKVYFRAGSGGNNCFIVDFEYEKICMFKTNKNLKVSGNIMYLLDGSSPLTTMTPDNLGCFYSLFANTTISDASELQLPAEELMYSCYSFMFSGCTSMIDAPALPAKVLESGCYENMFLGCTNLVNAPALPATELKSSCYSGMFSGCTSLIDAPALPATELESRCYDSMFDGCSNLVNAPALSAYFLADRCYQRMFKGCTKLVNAPIISATKFAEYSCYQMFQGCTGLTTFPDFVVEKLGPNCCEEMFSECTNLTEAPALPADSLANFCYQSMFKGCTKLVNAPTIPATKFAESSCRQMFQGCTGLTTVPDFVVEKLGPNCCQEMFSGCTKLTEAPALPADSLANYCYQSMFKGCTQLVNAPIISATKFEESSCSEMFSGCEKLSYVPDLKMIKLGFSSCFRMFNGCTTLETAPALPATELASYCYQCMFEGCTSLTTAPLLPATTLVTNCYATMFDACSKLSSVTMLATNGFEGNNSLYQWLDNAGTDKSITTRAVYVASGMVESVKATVPELWKTGVQVKP